MHWQPSHREWRMKQRDFQEKLVSMVRDHIQDSRSVNWIGTTMIPRLEFYEWSTLERHLDSFPTDFYFGDYDLGMLEEGDRIGLLFFRWMVSQVNSYKRRIVRLNRRHWDQAYDSSDSEETVMDPEDVPSTSHPLSLQSVMNRFRGRFLR